MPVTGIEEVAALLGGELGGIITDSVADGVQRGVLLGQAIVQGKASGRPGPRVVTGNYRRSIVGDFERSGDDILGQIGTNQPQGPRLEFGFYGTDVLGRNYNQPPYPHFLPALPEVSDAVVSQTFAALQGRFS